MILVFIAAAIPLALFAGWVVFFNAEQERRDSQKAALETLDRVVSRLSSEISQQLDIAETLAASAALDKPDLDAFYREATRVNDARELWQTIQLVDPSGNQILDATRPLGDELTPTADRENFDQIVKTRKAAIGGIGPAGKMSGKHVVAVRAPVERDGQLRFVLTAALVPDAISQILKSAGAPAGWVGLVADSKGNVVARTTAEQFELGQPASQSVRDAIAAAPDGNYVETTANGDEVDSIYRSLPGTSGWSVHFGIPSHDLNAPVLRSVIFLAGGGAVSFALALMLAWFTIRDISQRRKEQEAQAALALSASEERRRWTIDAANLGVFSWNFVSREAVVSPRARKMLRIDDSPVEGDSRVPIARVLENIDPGDRARFENALVDCRPGSVAVVDFRTLPPHGRWLRASGRLSRLDGADPDVVYGAILDIDETKRAELDRQHLLRRLGQAEENERRRIARELHDQIGQTITGLLLGLKHLEQMFAAFPVNKPAVEKLNWLQGLARGLGRDVHQVAVDLRPTALDDLGLHKALEASCSEMGRRFGIGIDLQILGNKASRLPQDIEIAVYRAVQEALTNAVKHANARNVSIVLDQRSDELRIVVEDDGRGFDLHAYLHGESRHSKLGLSGIEERLTLVGGSLVIETEPAHGTSLFMRIPLALTEVGHEPDPHHAD